MDNKYCYRILQKQYHLFFKLHFVFDTLQLTFELLVSFLFDLLSVTSYLSDIILNLNLLANMSSINESENSFN